MDYMGRRKHSVELGTKATRLTYFYCIGQREQAKRLKAETWPNQGHTVLSEWALMRLNTQE